LQYVFMQKRPLGAKRHLSDRLGLRQCRHIVHESF